MTGTPPFTPETFHLLEALARTPTAGFYHDHKAELKAYVEEPLRRVVLGAAERLPAPIRASLETRRNLFSRFLKNDFGQGGAWDHYWGAFYPREVRRITDVQLLTSINRESLVLGFYISHMARETRTRFRANLARLRHRLPALLPELLSQPDLLPPRADAPPPTWEEWLANPALTGYFLRRAIPKDAVLAMTEEEIVSAAARAVELFYPLFLLAKEDQPDAWLDARDDRP